jgi:hypothetical protein|tara:strand:- start:200 stop:895 length:696 start_codon:yes stop_codon:yes gene_type:complete
MAPRDKENEMLEKLRQRIRRAAANKKTGKQNIPSMLEEMGRRAKIGRPKIKDALKGSSKQSTPSALSIAVDQAKKADITGVAKKTQKDIDAMKERIKKAAANKKPSKQVKPSIMKEIESKTGKATGQGVFVSSAKKKKEPAKTTTTKKKAKTTEAKKTPRDAPKKETAKKKDKFAGEPRTIAQAKRMGKSYFINKAGKKLAAVTREDLKRKGLDPRKKSDLTKFLNMKRKK